MDLSGQKYGMLTPIKIVGKTKYRNNIWECVCDCGNVINVAAGNLRSKYNATHACGCQKNKRKTGDISNGIWSNLISNAKQRKIEVLVSRKDLYNIFEQQKGLCYLTNEPLIIGRGRKWYVENTASVDRLDSGKPYTKSNCRWCHKKINTPKSDLNLDEFLYWCNLIQHPIISNVPSPHCDILQRNGIWKTGIGNIRGQLWATIKHNANNRNILFDITIEQAWQVFLNQFGKCKITGIDLYFDVTKNSYNGTASLDRIDSSKGYTINNIQWVHKIINCCFKWNLTETEMYYWTKKVIDYNNRSCPEYNIGG